ncbi:excinuclease ABC subunit UvrB [Candidatus Uhrbacteria bacterium]|nr:excinuclease ABC subunit UvrB [Candidatus Uhrbacteria bacterium]
MKFRIRSKFKPAGDQPRAIKQLVDGLERGDAHQTLLGVTGSGKTFSIANVIEKVQRPTLVIAHNKTLAAQLCNEYREFFPDSAVEYFVSYYDYYQPEAYLPRTDTYIEKEAMINEEIDRLRHAATQALLTRRDVIIVASVSCIYNIGSPETYEKMSMKLTRGQVIGRVDILKTLTKMQYARTNAEVKRGMFRMRGQTFEVMPSNHDMIYRVDLSAQEVGEIIMIDPVTRKVREKVDSVWIFPTKHYVADEPQVKRAIKDIRAELKDRLAYFNKTGKLLEAERLERRTRYDLEMIAQVGFCHGIENYSRHFDGRAPGEPAKTLLDYFTRYPSPQPSPTRGEGGTTNPPPLVGGVRGGGQRANDWLLVIDESHVTLPQIQGMYEGDRSRKQALIEYGFRLPSAIDNRPLKFEEFEARMPQTIYTSATPGTYELAKSKEQRANGVVEQIIRPTGLVDPEIIVRPITGAVEATKTPSLRHKTPTGVTLRSHGVTMASKSQVEDLMARVKERVKRHERVMVTTLTKKMAEDLTEYLADLKIKVQYLHSDVDTLDRITILTDFRRGKFDVLVGVNLLREGLDLPEVSLVAILDADKEGFLRSETSLIQTIGRAARNVHGQVVLYADQMTGSITRAIRETDRRRKLQMAYNKAHGITPRTIKKAIKDITEGLTKRKEEELAKKALELETQAKGGRADDLIREKEKQMREAANLLQFELAAILRDEIQVLRKQSKKPANNSPS